ncbi:MAG: TIGR00282 family metallophosphoesterase [Eubacteriales bacterium]|nr:TIGR00282 family metallophosphoesterase [Eubacteriales bacterium]
MKILAIGDVVSQPGLQTVSHLLRRVKKQVQADFTIVNGENASGVGITPKQADSIFAAGADVITLGNHSFRKQNIVPYLEDNRYVIRPANLAPQSPGEGFGIYETSAGWRVLLFELIGRCDMQYGPDNPFLRADRILREQEGKYDVALCEIHASATSEKLAMGFYLDGRVAAVYGTHTHVPTADARVNPKGTGYITDLGMTGPKWSVLGIRMEQSIAMFRGDLTSRFEPAGGICVMQGAVFDIDESTGKCRSVARVEEEYLPEK